MSKRTILVVVLVLILGGFVWEIASRLSGGGGEKRGKREGEPAPVEVAAVEHGPIELRRAFSGTLESPARFVVAPKVGGRVERLAVDLADPVERGQVVAELDNDEYQQAVAQAEADLAVAQANLAEAKSSLEIADRDLERVRTLRDSGIGTESQFDAAKADQLAKQAGVEVARAQVTRAQAALSAAKIRLGYTKVAATWSGGDNQRFVARRLVDEGDTVAANTPLLSIVELDPITAVIHLTGRDYGRLQAGQPATLTTDAYAGETFTGKVARVAPVFQESSRQARAELTVANPQHRLKPGMFIRAKTMLDRVEHATIVPVSALTTRANETGVFVVNDDGETVSWRAVEVGITENNRVQVSGEGITGKVVTLGQQLLDDGSPITIPKPHTPDEEPALEK